MDSSRHKQYDLVKDWSFSNKGEQVNFTTCNSQGVYSNSQIKSVANSILIIIQ